MGLNECLQAASTETVNQINNFHLINKKVQLLSLEGGSMKCVHASVCVRTHVGVTFDARLSVFLTSSRALDVGFSLAAERRSAVHGAGKGVSPNPTPFAK